MRKILIIVWFFLPVSVLAYHYGPGQEGMVMDEVAATLEAAEAHTANSEWAQAIQEYDRALELLPEEETYQIRSVRLARSKALMFVSKLPQANRELERLLDELVKDTSSDPELVRETRSALANSQYYMTWLLRLEGSPEEEWRTYIDGARQNYRFLAERAGETGEIKLAESSKDDLDASIRLANMDLSDLQALPLPSQ